MGPCLPSIRIRAGALGIAVPCLYLEESIESPARSGIGPACSYMGLRLPCSVQMASKFGGMKPPQCPRAFTMALIGGAMEPGPSYTFDTFRLEPPPGGLWRGDVRLAFRWGQSSGWPRLRVIWRGIESLPSPGRGQTS